MDSSSRRGHKRRNPGDSGAFGGGKRGTWRGGRSGGNRGRNPGSRFFFREMELERLGADAVHEIAGLKLGGTEDFGLGFGDEESREGQEVGLGSVLEFAEELLGFGFLGFGQGRRIHRCLQSGIENSGDWPIDPKVYKDSADLAAASPG